MNWGTKQTDLILAPFDRCVDWLEGTPRSGKTTAGTMRFARHLLKSRDNIHLVTAYSAEQAYRLIMDGDGMGLLHCPRGERPLVELYLEPGFFFRTMHGKTAPSC